MAEVALLTLIFVLNIALPMLVVRTDLKRLRAPQLGRAWNDVTVLAACLLCGPLCLPVYFAKTRRSLAGLGLGLLWTAGVVAVLAGVDLGLSQLFAALGWQLEVGTRR